MKRSLILLLLMLIVSAGLYADEASLVGVDTSADSDISDLLISVPLTFTEDRGQWDEEVDFCAHFSAAAVWLMSDGGCYQFTRPIPVGQDTDDPNATRSNIADLGGDTSQRATDSLTDNDCLRGV